jgi:TolA-binding protein
MNLGKKYIFIFLGLIVLIGVSVKASVASAVYSVHCASYKMADKANDDVQKLLSLGYPAFYLAVEIEGKGKWYRVYAGKFDNKKKATLLAQTLLTNKMVSDYLIIKLPAENSVLTKKDKKVPTAATEKKKKSPAVSTKDADKSTQNPLALIEGRDPAKNERIQKTIKEIDEPSSGLPIYDKALGEMKQKEYAKALETFKEFVAREDTQKEWGERALRHMADCHYYLGEKGSKEHLLIAVEFYKNTLQSFPDPKKENASTYYRLARTYDYLKFYPEALRNYEYLISKYSNSSYASEAIFRIGELHFLTGKYNQAIEKLVAYLIKNRGGDYAKQAFYLIADCYYKTKQSANAEVWFRDAQKKWSDLADIPKEVVMDLGVHKYSLRRYDEAIEAFSFYVNMYSQDEKLKEVLLLLANSYKATDHISAALPIFNLIIDKYPESKEATESIMMMASLGVEKPGVKVVLSLNNVNYYKQPLDAYDAILRKNPTGEIAELATLRKADALQKMHRNKKAADVYLEFLNTYPSSKVVGEAREGFKAASAGLIDDYFDKKDYLAVAYIYFQAYKAIRIQNDEYKQVSKIALSLKELGLTEHYLNLLRDYKKVGKDEQILNRVILDIAEGQMSQGKYDEAQKTLEELSIRPSVKDSGLIMAIKKNQAVISYKKGVYDKAMVNYDDVARSGQNSNDPELRYWSQFYTGKSYLKMEKNADAQKTFAEIKTQSGPDGFWTKVVDYCVEDQKWWDKYGERLKK